MFRYTIDLGAIFVVALIFASVFVLYNLNLVPGQTNPSFTVPLVNAIAGHTVIYDALSTFNNASIAAITLT